MRRASTEPFFSGKESFLRLVEKEAERGQHLGKPMTLIRIEAPGVRTLVDLAMLYRSVAGSLRGVDRVHSVGGHELAALLLDTDAQQAEAPCERVRAALRANAARFAPRFGVGHVSAVDGCWQDAWRMAGALVLADGPVTAAA